VIAEDVMGGDTDAPSKPASESSESSGSSESAEGRRDAPRIYIPPARGSTRTRTGGGTRSISSLPRLVALVPDHVALTARPAPALSWFVPRAADAPLVLTLLRDDAVEPELEVTLATHVEAGIAEASLARWNVELDPGVVYKWSVALVADPEERERDVVASGAIERVPEPAGLAAERRAGRDGYRALAAHGLWYDALAELGGAIASGDEGLRDTRAALLDEVGLTSAADFERAAR
jgi:hypothetical protein